MSTNINMGTPGMCLFLIHAYFMPFSCHVVQLLLWSNGYFTPFRHYNSIKNDQWYIWLVHYFFWPPGMIWSTLFSIILILEKQSLVTSFTWAHIILLSNAVDFNCHRAFGYSSEDVQMVIETMAAQGKEPTFCMGDDIPLAVLSQKPHMLYDYFKQRFAQVGLLFSVCLLRYHLVFFSHWMKCFLGVCKKMFSRIYIYIYIYG